MARDEKSRTIDRRSMLKRSALAGGLMMMPGSLAMRGASSVAESETIERLGLLLPSEVAGTTLGRALRDGVAEGGRASGVRRIEILSEGTFRRDLEVSLAEHRLDAVVCFANTIHARDASEVAERTGRTVLLVDTGINPIDPRALSAGLRVATLDYFEKNRRIGERAAGRGDRAIVLSTSNEAGYQTAEAIRRGFEEGGGSIERYVVVDPPRLDRIDRDAVFAALADRPQVIFALGHRDELAEAERLVATRSSASLLRNHREDLPAGIRRITADAVRSLLTTQSQSVPVQEPAGTFGPVQSGAYGGVGRVYTG